MVASAICGRGMRRIVARPTLIMPVLLMPLIFVVSFTGAFGSLTRVEGYGTDNVFNWMAVYAAMQGAVFAGVGGASTTAELVHTLTPFIGIPLPNSIDNHQYLNAEYYKNKGCCWVLDKESLSIENLFNLILEIIKDKNKLISIENNMKNNSSKNVYSNIENALKDFI